MLLNKCDKQKLWSNAKVIANSRRKKLTKQKLTKQKL